MRINQAALFLPILLALLNACEDAKQAQTAPANTPTVLVSHPQAHSFNTALQLTGTARPNQTVKLYAMTSGFLQQLKVDIGDFVKADQVLAVLENPELYRDQQRLEALLREKKSWYERLKHSPQLSPTGAELKGKKAIYERLQSIYQKTPQLTTIVDVEKSQADYESLQALALAELEKAEADHSSLQAQNNVLSLQIKFLTLKAPFAGVIVNRYADKGALIQNGMNNANTLPVFELQDLQTIRVQVDVPETNVALIDKQSQADISFPELPETHYAAAISRMAYGLNESTKTMKVEIDLPNPDFKLRSGMYAKVDMQNSRRHNGLAVPNEAIGNIKGQSFVYLVNKGIVKKVEVKTGLRDEHATELLNPSIKEADTIVVQGKELVSDGASVQVKSL